MKRTIATIAIIGTGLIIFSACGRTIVKKSDVESLQNELALEKESKTELEAQMQEQIRQQNEEVTEIISKLAEISGKTTNLRINVENGAGEISQAEIIQQNIDAIKAKIASLEKTYKNANSKNKEFDKIITGLKEVIEKQEAEINSLKAELKTKDQKIQSQQETIDSQVETITRQNFELEEKVAEQAKLLYDAGCTLEELGDASPEVSWKKNKQKIESMTQSIYEQALLYYTKAYEAGYEAAAVKIESVSSKIQK